MKTQVKRFNKKKTYAGRTVKRTLVNTNSMRKKRPERTARSKRPVRSY